MHEMPEIPARERVPIRIRATSQPFPRAGIDDPRPPAYDIAFDFYFSGGFTDPEELHDATATATMLRPEVTDIMFKFAEADYFCRLLARYPAHEPAWMFHFDAFLGALRSTWEMIKLATEKSPDFEEIKKDMEANPNLSAFIVGWGSLRNKSFHESLDISRIRTLRTERFYQDGRREVHLRHHRIEIGGHVFEDATASCIDATNALWFIVKFCALNGLGRRIKTGPASFMETRFELEQKDGSWVDPLEGLKKKSKGAADAGELPDRRDGNDK